jgi:hypothetical protein
MISQKKLEANRRNAQKSTGPKTAEGKAISSQNGLTHGLTSRKCPILPGENEEEYRELQDALTRDLKPRGAMQRELVEDLVQARWKIRRIPAIEAELMCREQMKVAERHDTAKWRKDVPKDSEPDLCPIKILATQFLYERGTAFDRLDLYRTRLERQTHTILRELRKLREETGDDQDEVTAELLPRDTGLRPVQTQQQTGEERSFKTEPTEHGPEARVTGEQGAGATEDAIRKSEPTVCPISFVHQESRVGESTRYTEVQPGLDSSQLMEATK